MVRRIIHCADFHVDDKNIDEARKCLEFLVETVKTEKPDMVAIAGDIFNSENVKLDSLSAKLVFRIVIELADVAPVVCITGTKSHDGTASEALRYIRAKNHVFVSTMPEQVYLMPGGSFVKEDPLDTLPILTISQVPTPTKRFFQSAPNAGIDATNQEIAAAMSAIFGGFGAKAQKYDCPHVLVGHFSIGGAFVADNQRLLGVDIELSTDQLELANTSLNMLGHIHFFQKVGDKTYYSGDLFQSDFGEAGQEKGFYLHEIDDATGLLNKSTLIPTPYTHLCKLTFDLTGPQTDYKLSLTQENKDQIKDAVVKIEITVYEDEASKINREDLESNMAEAKSYEIKIIRVPRENVRSEKLLKMTTLKEKIIEWARLRGEEVPESILKKADDLESMESDEVVKIIGSGEGDC